jgi:hypothetical protein
MTFASLDGAFGFERLLSSLTPGFSPVTHHHSSQLSRFNGFLALAWRRQRSADASTEAKPLKRLASISREEPPA